jgi:signal peptidase II
MTKLSLWLSRTWPVLLTATVVIALDQWTKIWVRNTIPKYTYTVPIPSLGEYFVFEHVENYGAAFGILQGRGGLFITIAFIVAIAILYYATTLPPEKRWLRILLGLQLGGALGNVIDRIYQGYVTDFVKMGIPGRYYWPNYNIADAAIVVGVIGLAIYILVEDLRLQREQRAAAASAQPADQQPVRSQDGS